MCELTDIAFFIIGDYDICKLLVDGDILCPRRRLVERLDFGCIRYSIVQARP